MAVTDQERTALALVALGEVTDPADVGELVGVEQPEPGVVDLRFACTLPAYAGWSWIVSTADLPDHEATVLEVELLPGDGALLAPPWVPWTDRLADWRRQHPDERHPGEDSLDDDSDDEAHDDDGEVDEDDLAVDDELDVLDETELDVEAASEEPGSEGADVEDAATSDDLGDEDDDERDLRPADEDRGP